jgi:Tol biopolymer transport system component
MTGDLYTVNPNGSHLRRLTHTGQMTVQFSFSPDGSKILFAHTIGGDGMSPWNVSVMNANGTGFRAITHDRTRSFSYINEFPSWTPSGKIRYFRVPSPGIEGVAPAPGKGLWVANADGTGARRVVANWVPSEPTWSPDGSRVAWSTPRGLVIGDARGAHRFTLTSDPNDAMPSWSPDGQHVVYVQGQSVLSIGPDGTAKKTLFTCACELMWPSWSPDASQVVFSAVRKNLYGLQQGQELTEIDSVRSDGTGARVITRVPFRACCPVWQPISNASPTSPHCPSVSNYHPSVTDSIVAVGSSVTISGPVPIYGENGSFTPYDPGDTVQFWWNLDPNQWDSAITTGGPSPAVPGASVQSLGEKSIVNTCSYELTFTVPDVPVGTYPIIGLYMGGDGVASLTPVSIHVGPTSPGVLSTQTKIADGEAILDPPPPGTTPALTPKQAAARSKNFTIAPGTVVTLVLLTTPGQQADSPTR